MVLLITMSPSYSADRTDDYLSNKPGGNSLDKNKWEKIKDDYKYKSPKLEEASPSKPSAPGIFQFPGIASLLAYAAIFILFAGLIYLLVRNGFLGRDSIKNNPVAYSINIDPHDINDFDVDPLLKEALKNKDYRLAIRLRFLAVLQLLNTKKLITWKRDRTNFHYLQQIKGNPIRLPFGQVSLIYEKAWYGDYPIHETQYHQADETFNSLISMINNSVK